MLVCQSSQTEFRAPHEFPFILEQAQIPIALAVTKSLDIDQDYELKGESQRQGKPVAAMKQKSTRVTSFDVARRAGVSQPSVSRAFTPGASITKDKRDRVLAAAKELNYVPNVFASNLSSNKSNMVAVISGNLNNPFYSESLQVFVESFQRMGRQVLAFSVQEGHDCDDVMMQALRYPVDGIVVTSAQMSSDLIRMSEGLGIPIVMFNRRVSGSELASVQCDNIEGSAALGRLVHAAGARRILIVLGDLRGSTSGDRVSGFRSALETLGGCTIEEIEGGSSYSGARNAMIRRFGGPSPQYPDAIFAVNDIMAIGCADALREVNGLRIPDDIMLAGFDGIREGQRAPYRLTTVRQPIERMVSETLELLKVSPDVRKIEGGEKRVIPGDLIPGRTVPGMERQA